MGNMNSTIDQKPPETARRYRFSTIQEIHLGMLVGTPEGLGSVVQLGQAVQDPVTKYWDINQRIGVDFKLPSGRFAVLFFEAHQLFGVKP